MQQPGPGWAEDLSGIHPGFDATVVFGALVSLDGSGSNDQEGDLLSYSWSFSSRPPDSATTESAPIDASLLASRYWTGSP